MNVRRLFCSETTGRNSLSSVSKQERCRQCWPTLSYNHVSSLIDECALTAFLAQLGNAACQRSRFLPIRAMCTTFPWFLPEVGFVSFAFVVALIWGLHVEPE